MLTHEEMMVQGRTQRDGAATIERLDASLLEGKADTYLFNIYSMPIEGHSINLGTAGQYYIPPCPEGKEYICSPHSVPGVVADTYPHFTDKEEYRVRARPSSEVVACILGIGVGQSKGEDIRRFGVFASQSKIPTKQEISEAKTRLVIGLQAEMRKADELFASAKPDEKASVQSEHFYVAARYLGVKKPWMSESQLMTTCPFCAIGVSPAASICHGCNQIINQAAFEATKKQMAGV